PGAGAAGGLGFGMMAFFGATLRPGIQIVLDAVKLQKRLIGADLCITGEGRLDSQSLAGKTAIGVARLCRERYVPCVPLAGWIGEGIDAVVDEGITAHFAISRGPETLESAMKNATKLLADAAENVARLFAVRPGCPSPSLPADLSATR